MLILVHGNGFELGRELRDDVHEKIQLILSRFANLIGKVDVYLADLNGPKKGVDKSIRFVIDVERQPAIVIEEKGEDWQALLESVSDRAVHTVTRQLDRSRVRKRRTSMGFYQASDADSLSREQAGPSDHDWNPLRARPEAGR